MPVWSSRWSAVINQRGFLSFLGILGGIEICYFLSGYIFWYGHNVLSFWWSRQFSLFPSYYCTGFWVIPCLIVFAVLILEKFRNSSFIRDDKLIIGILFFASFVNAFALWGIPEINPDSILWNYQARYLANHGILSFLLGFGKTIGFRSGLPLPTLIFGLAYKLLGVHRFAIQTVNSIFFSLIVVLVYLIGKEIFAKNVGFYSAILMLSSPFMVSQVPLTLIDVPTTFFVTLGIYQIVRMVKKPGMLSSTLGAVTVILASMCKLTALLFLLPFLVVFYAIVLLQSRHRFRVLRSIAFFSLVFAVFFSAFVLGFYAAIISRYPTVIGNSFASILFHPTILNASYHTLAASIVKSLILSVTLPVFILSLVGLFIVLLRRDKLRFPSCLLMMIWIVVPTMYTLLPALYATARYAMPTYPAYTLLAATSLTAIKDKRLRRIALFSILIFSIANTHYMYAYAWNQSSSRNLMAAAEYLQPRIAQGATVTVCYDPMSAWMSIYAPPLYPTGNPNFNPRNLFSCVNPNSTLPEYLVLVRGIAGNTSAYPTMSPQELQFLSTHYAKIATFQGGDLEGPWIGITVEVYMAYTFTAEQSTRVPSGA